MLKIVVYNSFNKISSVEKINLVDFLYQHLDEFGDERKDIEKAVDYATNENANLPLSLSFGGFILVAKDDKNNTTGAVVVNRTGMTGYIPDNILVYIATHKKHRGKGIGKALLKKTIEISEGDIALHVEPENPARYLYEKLGFSNKYLEMRYKKQI